MHTVAAGERVRGLHDVPGRGDAEQGREAEAHREDCVHAVGHYRPAHHSLPLGIARTPHRLLTCAWSKRARKMGLSSQVNFSFGGRARMS